MLPNLKTATQRMQPIPEGEYVRIIYVGKMVLKENYRESKGDTTTATLDEIIADIWKCASVFNKANFIGGHLVWTKNYYVAQILEGSKEVVMSLLERIKKDPRVVVEKVYTRDLQTMHTGWDMSMGYSFQKTREQHDFIDNKDVSLEQVFNRIPNTHKITEEGSLTLPQFYMHTINMFVMKYMSLEESTEHHGKDIAELSSAVAGVGTMSPARE